MPSPQLDGAALAAAGALVRATMASVAAGRASGPSSLASGDCSGTGSALRQPPAKPVAKPTANPMIPRHLIGAGLFGGEAAPSRLDWRAVRVGDFARPRSILINVDLTSSYTLGSK